MDAEDAGTLLLCMRRAEPDHYRELLQSRACPAARELAPPPPPAPATPPGPAPPRPAMGIADRGAAPPAEAVQEQRASLPLAKEHIEQPIWRSVEHLVQLLVRSIEATDVDLAEGDGNQRQSAAITKDFAEEDGNQRQSVAITRDLAEGDGKLTAAKVDAWYQARYVRHDPSPPLCTFDTR